MILTPILVFWMGVVAQWAVVASFPGADVCEVVVPVEVHGLRAA